MGLRARRPISVLVFALLVLLGAALRPSSACALSVTAEAKDNFESADLTVQVGSSDVTGTLVLDIDGQAYTARPVTPGDTIALSDVRMRPGTRIVRAYVRSRSGIIASEPLSVRVWTNPTPALLVAPTPGGYAAQYVAGSVKSGFSTTAVSVYLNGRLIVTTPVMENALQQIGTLLLGKGVNTIKLVATNPVAQTVSTFSVSRLDYPWPTCIIIDKSDCKLYWIKDGTLVKVYPIAVGKRSTQTPVATWKVGAKYQTAPGGIYGPRKMRLYRKTSSGYVFTAYNIHGTNQPWVIGTWASHGCIRMYNSDVLDLYPQVALGTMVQTRE